MKRISLLLILFTLPFIFKAQIPVDYLGFTEKPPTANSLYDGTLKDHTFHIIIDFSDTVFTERTELSGVKFMYDGVFFGAQFKHKANFKACTFSAIAQFKNVAFFDSADFTRSQFGLASFDHNYFGGEIDFYNSRFLNVASFDDLRFDSICKGLYFSRTTFNCKLSFVNARDYGKTDLFFFSAKFDSGADFSKSEFHGDLLFDSARFSNTINFSSTQFGYWLSFRNAQLKPNTLINFSGARLPVNINFSRMSNIPIEIDLTQANFDRNIITQRNDTIHYINLYKADIPKIHLDYDHFKLDFYDNGNNLVDDEKSAIYEQVLKNFKDRGQEESYKKLDIEYRQFQWSNKPWIIRWFNTVQKLWWNYGYEKELIFVWTIALFIFFSLGVFLNFHHLQNEVYKVDDAEWFTYKDWKLRFWNSCIYTSAIFFPLTLKREKMKFNSWGLAYILIIYIAGIVCLAYMANFVLQK